MASLDSALSFVRNNHERQLSELNDLLRIPGISTQAEHKDDLLRTADWLAGHMQRIGLEHVTLMPTAGYPVV